MKAVKANPLFKGKSDRELAESAAMLVASLSELHQELESRGIDCSIATYEGGEMRPTYTRLTKEHVYGQVW